MRLQVLAFLALVAACTALPVENCGGVTVKVNLPECPSLPCSLKRGAVYEVDVDFTSPISTSTLTAAVHGQMARVWVPWIGFNRNACNGNNIACPVKQGQQLTYKAKLDIKAHYPVTNVQARFKLEGDSKQEIFCFTFPMTIRP